MNKLVLLLSLVPSLAIGQLTNIATGQKISTGTNISNVIVSGGGGGLPSGAVFELQVNANLNDASGNGNNFTLGAGGTANYTTNINNVANKAFRFDGSTFIEAPNTSLANVTSGDFSISTWCFIPGSTPFTGSPVLWSKGNFGNTGYYGQLVSDGGGNVCHFAVFFNTPSSINTAMAGSTLTHDIWYNIIFVRSGTTGKIYTNGVDTVATSATMNNPVTDGTKFRIGAYSGGSAFVTGNEDHIVFWNRALNSTECASVFSLGPQ